LRPIETDSFNPQALRGRDPAESRVPEVVWVEAWAAEAAGWAAAEARAWAVAVAWAEAAAEVGAAAEAGVAAWEAGAGDRMDFDLHEELLNDFVAHWPTHAPSMYVDFLLEDPPDRMGRPGELRLTERWTQGARSVFIFQGAGAVGKASFAGLPWLHAIRGHAGQEVHFWPFDGWDLPEGKSVLVEAYPAICRRRYPKNGRTADEHDAYALATWLRGMDERGALDRYGHPPITEPEKFVAELEGWIFGVS
jgi:hypothetical protein